MDGLVITKCTDLKGAHIAEAARSSEAMEALLTRFAEIAAPGKGAPILLAAIARLGTTACRWLEGELRVELAADGAKTKIAILTTIGGGFREKVFPDTVLDAPLEEFSRTIARSPKIVEPLLVKDTGRLIVLSATAEVRQTSLPPPMVKVDESSLFTVPKNSPPALFELDMPSLEPQPKIVLRPKKKPTS